MATEYPPSWFLPRFRLGRGGIFPDIKLPSNYLELVPKFYEQGRREEIDNFKKGIERFMTQVSLSEGSPEIRLNWDDRLGLRNIQLGIHGGLDLLDERKGRFVPHNLGGTIGIYGGIIAMEYIRELVQADE